MSSSTPQGTGKADHLCVIVHGLWGNPNHLKYVSNSLRNQFSEDKIDILVAKRNAGSFTYDGIELGGERVASEVEERLEELARAGHTIKKISVIGYSLGGLISRYAVGLLYSRGVFDIIQPTNFTTFATPHLGVRTPLRGYHSHVWNVLGARTLSMSGRQLFGIDSFRETGRPILAVLADPERIFLQALKLFKHRSLYANVVNDRTVTYYTAGISSTDPFVRLEEININYIPDYNDVIIDGTCPVTLKDPVAPLSLAQRLTAGTKTVLARIPIIAFLTVFIPIGSTLFLANSAIQSFRSVQRIRLHEEGRAGIDITRYRASLMINAARQEVEDMFENVNNGQEQDYLSSDSDDPDCHGHEATVKTAHEKISLVSDGDSTEVETDASKTVFPRLALTEDQFRMITALDQVGFKKYPVHIHNHRHTHAAIIVRMDKDSFDEGRMVVKHWLDNFVM